jgi:hypothetical protein
MITLGYIFLGLAGLITCLNFYLSFVGPLYFWLMKQGHKFGSGLPALGTISLVLAVLLLPKTLSLGWASLAMILLDTGGIPWFLVMMLYFRFFKQKPN